MITKKDFIALADSLVKAGIRNDNAIVDKYRVINVLADYCQSRNPHFNRERWLDYIAGKCGPNGGKIK